MPTSLTSGQNCFPHTCKTLECPSAVGCRMSSLSGDYRSVGTQHAQVISNTHVLLPCPIHGDFSGVRSPDAPRTLRKGKRLTMAVEQRTSRTVGFWIQPYMCTWHQTRLCHGAVCFPHGKWLNQFYFIHRSVWLYHQRQTSHSDSDCKVCLTFSGKRFRPQFMFLGFGCIGLLSVHCMCAEVSDLCSAPNTFATFFGTVSCLLSSGIKVILFYRIKGSLSLTLSSLGLSPNCVACWSRPDSSCQKELT
uniref:uncharacterized protein LOC132666666 isoform X1 n=1 Tax=Panthera onca TaxID=9690 RepID=UPI002953C21D|nr:uncharacterized protein LOC132666666 isoform X1 [Panthera onca]XP_060470661.1 uncharacterized protein LOC132666666 isoform X1 [Panthera onca]XP_060470662.1 uncharacterized protein LOC132666666 isoform X1 [Panthera onca]XP_060470663.1 uncharacterized protein LOC132666666 isoform X1 [Panthera onca]XP_060470664.1 uncharacterized protein LOC132666666 isoform X1 [Panthera onca]